MGFNYRQKKKEFERNWAKARKEYIAAGMTEEQIAAVREFDESLLRQERIYENRVTIGLPDLNIRRFSKEERCFENLSRNIDFVLDNLAPGLSTIVSNRDKSILLMACAGYTQQEIALKVGITQAAVCQRLCRIQALLQKKL